MSKPSSQPSILTWILAGTGVALWAIGTMGWMPDTLLHPISYALILIAALTADPVIGRSGSSNLQLGYTVVAWLMVALMSVTEALSLGGILFFGFMALTMTFMYFHPSFRLRTRVTLYMFLLALVWGPALYSLVRPDDSDATFGMGSRAPLLIAALVISGLFFGFAMRWISVPKSKRD